MTLKTSLIITGDASVARKEVSELTKEVAALAAGARAAAPAAKGLDQAQAGIAATARPAADAIGRLDDAQGRAAASARDLAQTADVAKTAQAAGATAAREAAAAQQSYGQAVAQTSVGNRTLIAANDHVAASTAAAAQQLAGIEAAQEAAATGATAHSAAAQGLQAAIGTMVTQIAGGATVFEAMAANGGVFASALDAVAQASVGAKAGIDATGGSGAKAGVDLGGLGDTLVDTAGKAEGMGGKLGSVAAILGGPWGAAIGIGVNLLGGFISGLIEGAAESDNLADSSMSLADALSTQGKATDAARVAIENYNRQSDQARQRMVVEEQQLYKTATAWLAKAAATRADTKAKLEQRVADGSTPYQAIGGSAMGGGNFLGGIAVAGLQKDLRQQEADIAKVQQNRRNLLIEEGKRTATAVADPLAAINATYDRMAEKAELAAAKNTKLAKSFGETLAQIERSRKLALDKAKPDDTPAIRVPTIRATPSPGSARDTAAEAAADAQRQLARDLDQVTSRYLPATAAAKDYADALAQIDRLVKAFDPKKAGSGLSPEQAAQARAAAEAANASRMRELALTPEMRAADEARKSIDGVIAALGRETAARATLDPVQRAMIQHQAQLAALTGEERTKREAALEGYYRQADATRAIDEATRAAAEAQRQFRDMALDAFDAVAIGGENAGKVIDSLAKRIASAAIEAAVLGTGPLAALMKGGATAAPVAGGGGATGQAAADILGKSVGKSVGDRLDSVFGKGNSGKVIQNAGFGYTAASIMGGSGIGGGIGGAIGGEVAKKAFGAALGSLGSFAGPLGSIAGGILGGVVGKLFGGKPKEYGSAAITIGADGLASAGAAIGKGTAEREKASALGGSVAEGLNRIAQQLGAELGSASVSVGYRPGHKAGAYRVDPTGSGKVKDGSVQAFETEAEAIAFAIRDAISDGAVKGLSAAVQKALQSSADVDKAVAEATKVQALEAMMAGVTGTIDKAFRDFEVTAKERVRIATTYGFDLVAIEKKNGEDRAKIAAQLQAQQVGSLQKLIDEMTQGALFEGSALDKLAVLNTAIGKAQTDVTNGVEGAGDTLADLLAKKVAASKDAYGTTGAYNADRMAVVDQARTVIGEANARIAAAQTGKSTSDPALATTNRTLDEMADQNAKVIAALDASNALLSRIAAGSEPAGLDLRAIARY